MDPRITVPKPKFDPDALRPAPPPPPSPYMDRYEEVRRIIRYALEVSAKKTEGQDTGIRYGAAREAAKAQVNKFTLGELKSDNPHVIDLINEEIWGFIPTGEEGEGGEQ